MAAADTADQWCTEEGPHQAGAGMPMPVLLAVTGSPTAGRQRRSHSRCKANRTLVLLHLFLTAFATRAARRR